MSKKFYKVQVIQLFSKFEEINVNDKNTIGFSQARSINILIALFQMQQVASILLYR